MIEAEHTPGPFFVHDFTALGGTVDVSCDHPATLTVASMGNALTGTHAEKVANAHLFAAAPNLLAACETARLACQDNLKMYMCKNEVALMKALIACTDAIAKVTGRV